MKVKVYIGIMALLISNISIAIPIDYAGDTYEVTTFTTSYAASTALLESQVWWGDSAVATIFSDLTNDDFGSVQFSQFGPFFSYAPTGSTAWDLVDNRTEGWSYSTTSSHVFAIATKTSVPAPTTLALFGLGLAGLGWSRRKKA